MFVEHKPFAKRAHDFLQTALEAVLKTVGFSKVTTHSMNWEDMTTGSQHVPEVDASAIYAIWFVFHVDAHYASSCLHADSIQLPQ